MESSGAAVASSLLSPERSAWIYGGGAPSRQQRGENCHRNENGCRARHRRHISWTDLEQHRGNQAARNHREREADDGAGSGKSETVAKHHRDQLWPRRTEGRADADLTRALRNRRAQHTVDTDGRKHQGNRTKQCDQPSPETRLASSRPQAVAHRLHIVQGKIRIKRLERGPNARHNSARVAAHANDQVLVSERKLTKWHVRAGRRGRIPPSRGPVDEKVFTGTRERVEWIVRGDRMHRAD